MRNYLHALILTTSENARDWIEGAEKLKGLGFTKQIRKEGHRHFVTMVWPDTTKDLNND